MENIWLETDALGLGGVWIGTAPLQERMDAVRSILNIPDSLEVFAHHLTNNRVIGYKDPSINSSMTLSKDGARVMFFKGNKLYSMKMRK